MNKTIAIIGTFDTKGREYAYLKDLIEQLGCKTLTINTGVFKPLFTPDIAAEDVAKAVGANLEDLVKANDRAQAMEVLSKGLATLVPQLYKEGKFDGLISLGGSGGTSLATAAMQKLPIGVPKVMVSTVASGDTTPYVGESDLVMMPSVVDVSGLNSISTTIFKNAAASVVGMVNQKYKEEKTEIKPTIAATMFGVTTACVTAATAYLEEKGYEVLVFHATGVGGRNMEHLIRNGFIKGVLDLTTTEWCDEIAGGVLSAGQTRCEAAADMGIPTVMSVGATDMVNFGPFDTVPVQFKDRNLYKHNPTITLMRTTVEECKEIGTKLAEKINRSNPGTAAFFIPKKGVSAIDVEGAPFYGKEEDEAMFNVLRNNIDKSKVELIEMDTDINDNAFAIAAAKKLLELMGE